MRLNTHTETRTIPKLYRKHGSWQCINSAKHDTNIARCIVIRIRFLRRNRKCVNLKRSVQRTQGLTWGRTTYRRPYLTSFKYTSRSVFRLSRNAEFFWSRTTCVHSNTWNVEVIPMVTLHFFVHAVSLPRELSCWIRARTRRLTASSYFSLNQMLCVFRYHNQVQLRTLTILPVVSACTYTLSRTRISTSGKFQKRCSQLESACLPFSG